MSSVATVAEISICPVNQTSLTSRHGVNFLVGFGFKDVSIHTRIVDLTRSEADLWADLAQDARQRVKRARQAGYTVEEVSWSEAAEEYYRVHLETYSRTGHPPFPRLFHEGFIALAQDGHAKLSVGRAPDGRMVAFHNSAIMGTSYRYWTGCCEDAHLDSGINYLLIWQALLRAKSAGGRMYEIGEVFPGVSDSKLRGLTIFKSKFGGEVRRVFRGQMALAQQATASPTKPSFRSLFRTWCTATADLLKPVIGGNAVNVAKRGARLSLQSTRRALGSCRDLGARLNRMRHPPIPFLKPAWEEEERRIGCGETAIDESAAAIQFVDAFRRITRVGSACAVVPTGSGRTALDLALRVLKKQDASREKVILPSYCCRGILEPVVRNGLTPVFVDIDQDLLTSRTHFASLLANDVLACLLVHLTGKRLPVEEMIPGAAALGIATIEDHCQFMGGIPSPEQSGAAFYIFSFGLGKNAMASAGGALVAARFQEQVLAEAALLQKEPTEFARRRFARCWSRFFGSPAAPVSIEPTDRSQFGFVSMNPVDAAILKIQFGKLAAIIQKRRENAALLSTQAAASPQLYASPTPENHTYTKFGLRVRTAAVLAAFWEFSKKRGIELEPLYVPLHLQPCGSRFRQGPLPVTEEIHARVVSVPVRPNLDPAEVDRISRALADFGRHYLRTSGPADVRPSSAGSPSSDELCSR